MYYANTKETAYFLPLDGTVTGQISSEFDEIWFYLEAAPGMSGMYYFYTEDSATTVPMVGTLANSNGFVTDISVFDNGRFTMYPVIDENEIYYLLMMSHGEGTGQFTLKTRPIDLDNPGFQEDAPGEVPLKNPSNKNMAADPVDISRGAFTSKIDLLSFNNGQHLTLSAHYDSQLRCSGALGLGWHYNYEKKLVHIGSSILLFESPQNYHVYQSNPTSNCYDCSTPGKEGYTIKLENNSYHLDCNKERSEWYDSSTGALIKVVDHQGHEITLTHSANSIIIRDTMEGHTITLSIENGKLVRATDSADREVILSYSDNLLTAIEDVNGNTLTFNYNEEFYLVTATDSLGITYVTNFYSNGKVVAQRDAGYNFTYFDYEGNNVTVTNRNGDASQRIYDDAGLLISYTDENGNTSTYTYDARGNMLTETDALGNTKTMEYNGFNKPTRIVDKRGNTTTLTYDENGNVTFINHSNGGIERFTYGDFNRLKTHIDPKGMLTEFTYDETGHLITQKQGERSPITYEYSDSTYDHCDPKGIWHYHDLDDCGRISVKYVPVNDEEDLLYSTLYEYNASGDCLKITDPLGNSTTFEYDANHQKIAETDAEGHRTTYQYNGNMKLIKTTFPDNSTIVNGYDNEDRLISVTDQMGKVTTTTYDAGGRVVSKQFPDGGTVSYTYDAVGNVLTETNPLGGVTTRTYDAMGNVLTETAPDGSVTEFTYNAMEQMTQKYPYDVGTFNYSYSTAGLLTWEEDASGREVYYSYDVYGNKISERIGYDDEHKTTYTYDANNNLLTVTDRLGNTTSYEYDSCDRCVKVTDALNRSTLFGYDACGRRTTVTDPRNHTVTTAYDNVGNVLSVTDAKGNVILSKTYNNRNLPVTVTDAEGTRTYTYNAAGKPLTVTDAFGTKQFAYDDMGRNTQVTDEANGVSTTTFNLMGQPLTVTGPGGAVTTYTYDTMGRNTSQTTPSGETVTYSNFHSSGKPQRMVDARGNLHQYSYNHRGQMLSHIAPGMSETYTFDAEGNLLTSSDGSHTVTRTYDLLNRMTSSAETDLGTLEYTYDSVGNIVDIGGSYACVRTYDAKGNLTSVREMESSAFVSYTYDENDRLLTETKPDGSITTYTYDAYQRLVSKIARKANQEMIIGYEYTYDARGRLATEEDLVKNKMMCYTYDNRNWVTNRRTVDLATETYVDDPFTYDPAGNLQNLIGDPTPTYDANNRLTEYKGTTLHYDADGNMTYHSPTGIDAPLYSYDAKNRMTGNQIEFFASYNADNLRYQMSDMDGNELVRYSYLNDTNSRLSRVVCRYDLNDPAAPVYYLHGLGLVCQYDGFDIRTYHFDYRGSTVAITDSTGNITDTFEYDTYGKRTAHTGATNTPFQYNGRDGVMTDGNGLLYMRARYYDPNMRRFINADILPGGIDNAVTLNRYAYANANPVTNIDPFGLSAERGQLGPSALEAAHMAQHVYSFDKDIDLPGGWTCVAKYAPLGDNGVVIGVYTREHNGIVEYAVVNKGTTMDNAANWVNNALQIGGASPDVWMSIAFAEKFVNDHPDAHITFVGHSKGGVEAAYNAVSTNRNAILFNPAPADFELYGLSRLTYTADIDSYVIAGDLLDTAVNAFMGPIPDTTLDKIYLKSPLKGKKGFDFLLANHGIATMILALENPQYLFY